MNDQTPTDPIDRIRRESIPPCPGSIEANVWRKIRQRATSEADASWWDWIDALVPQKQFLTGAIALAIIASASTAMLALPEVRQDRADSARIALDFDSIAHAPRFPFDNP